MAAPIYQSNTSNTGTTTVVLNVPASTASGDTLIAIVIGNRFGQTWSTPSGWTLIEQGEIAGGGAVTAVFSRVASGSEPANYTFTFSAAFATSGNMVRITGGNTTTPVDSHVSNTSTGGTSNSIGSISPTTTTDLVLEMYFIPSGGTGTHTYACTNVSSFTEQFVNTSIGEMNFATGASTASGSATASFTKQFNNAWWACALSIAPEPAATTVPDLRLAFI